MKVHRSILLAGKSAHGDIIIDIDKSIFIKILLFI